MNIVAILNRHAGRGSAAELVPALRVHLHAALAAVCMPASAEEAANAAADAVRDGADVILAAGGDGTVNAVINGMQVAREGERSRTALALLPVGTANDLATQHGLDANVQRTCLSVLARRSAHIDLIDVNGWRYATDGGIGLCASVARHAMAMRASMPRDRRRMLGASLYSLATLRTLAAEPRQSLRMRIEEEGNSLELSSPLLMVNNQRLLGAHFPVSPGACNHDGLFDVCLVTGRDGRRGLLRLVSDVLRERHLAQPDFRGWQARALRIETERPVAWLGDGELAAAATLFDVRILPAALRLILPSPSTRIRCN